MALTEALAALADQPPGSIRVERHEPERDRKARQRLARWAQRFSPEVGLDEPDGLWLDVVGTESAMGPFEQQATRAREALAERGITARVAVAPTHGAAWALSRFAAEPIRVLRDAQQVRDALGPLPVACLRLEPATVSRLGQVGVHRVEQLLRLRRKSLPSRLGEQVQARLDQAFGEAWEMLEPIRPQPAPRVDRRFEGAVLQTEALARAVRELIDELAARLAAEGLGTLHLRLEVHRAGLQALSLSTRFSLPTASPEHWWSMLRHVLEGVHLGYGVEALCLKAEVVRAITAEQGVLPAMTGGGDQPWKAQQLEHARAELIDHLVQRLGHEAVRVPVERDTWVPERALAFHPVLEVGSAGRTTPPAPRPCHADRPLRLLQRPEPLCGNPLRQGFAWRGRTRTPTRRIGPERITLPWWESQPDRPPVIRDYYKVMDTEHRWWWLFRRVGEGDWWLHGLWN